MGDEDENALPGYFHQVKPCPGYRNPAPTAGLLARLGTWAQRSYRQVRVHNEIKSDGVADSADFEKFDLRRCWFQADLRHAICMATI